MNGDYLEQQPYDEELAHKEEIFRCKTFLMHNGFLVLPIQLVNEYLNFNFLEIVGKHILPSQVSHTNPDDDLPF